MTVIDMQKWAQERQQGIDATNQNNEIQEAQAVIKRNLTERAIFRAMGSQSFQQTIQAMNSAGYRYRD